MRYPYFKFAQGLAEYHQGHFERAISVMRGEASHVLGPGPRLVLAMSLYQSGNATEAQRTLAAAIQSYDWRTEKVRDQDGWIFHVLRREAEALISPNRSDVEWPHLRMIKMP